MRRKKLLFLVVFLLCIVYGIYWLIIFYSPEYVNVSFEVKIANFISTILSFYVSFLVWRFRVKQKIREIGHPDILSKVYSPEGMWGAVGFFVTYSAFTLINIKLFGFAIRPLPRKRSHQWKHVLITPDDAVTVVLLLLIFSVFFLSIYFFLSK